MTPIEIKELLDETLVQYENSAFVEDDPIQIPHRFTHKEDIEIAGFLAATLAWGQRKTIIRNAERLMEMMNHQPFNFVVNARKSDFESFKGFVHRTFNSDDLVFFLKALQVLYSSGKTLEYFFNGNNVEKGLIAWHRFFFNQEFALNRSKKHLSNPQSGSACKRLNMFLRWMVRSPEKGVDFGIWSALKPKDLIIPLDVHVHRVAIELKLIDRKQADWKAANALTEQLAKFDSLDPIKYDLALFCMGRYGIN